ncbi:UPF0104 family protein [Romboutsia maritimum]|uniref:Phosphatidylglycerol lysyltransferase n=1 Tax=Romboutsia maritimum TaxID=2020948 RepID=A0A371IRK7_9FIRM|nr:lysylphosphatidylglycerol synthase transmembrane domain-containing protein [Romboutsia maritimum]RDY23104.1 UPF0104 family protein [Romboutsia maritimum]
MKKNLSKTKSLLQYIFLILLAGLTIYLVSKNLDITMLKSVIKMVDKKFILLGIVSVVFYIMLEAIVLRIIIDSIYKVKVRFLGFKLASMGFYYNLVTPFASGSQPMQVYILNKFKMPLGKATAVVTNKSIIYQLVVTLYCTVLAITNMGILKKQMPVIIPFIYLGIAINMFTLVIVALIVLNPVKIKKFSKFFIKHASKVKVLRFLENKLNNIEHFIDEYSESIGMFAKNKKILATTILITVIQLSAYFSISFWVYKAFNLDGYSYLYLLTLQTFLYMAISPIPTPGNIGANEIAFLTIFKSVFPKPLMGYAVFLYGGFVYYLILIGSGILTVITHYRMKHLKNENKQLIS